MKSEKEKMLSGELFKITDRELEDARTKSRIVNGELNNLYPDNLEKVPECLSRLFGHVGKNVFLIPPFKCDYGFNISIGENTFINNNCIFLDIGKIKIGKDVLIGPNTGLYAVSHPIYPDERKLGMEYGTHITIGDNVWIGGSCVINNGVIIGKNSIIGSGSVVTKDIPENVIAAGNPCRVIRKITENDRMLKEKNNKTGA